MTPSQQCKAAGLPSLAYVSRVSTAPVSTLKDWHKTKPSLFRVVVAGVKAINKQEKGNEILG